MFLGTIRNGAGVGDKCLELPIGIEFSDRIHRPDRDTPDEENGKVGRVCEAKEKWNENIRVG